MLTFCSFRGAGHSMSEILHSWKSHAVHQANQLLGRKGKFWFPDYFDEFMKFDETVGINN